MRPALRRISILLTWLSLQGLISCDLNKIDYTSDDSKNVVDETTAESYFEDAADMSSTAVSVPNDTEGGRKVFAIADNRFHCAQVSLEVADASTLLIPKGVITIDFGSACADAAGNTRSGKILVTYSGRRFLPGSAVTITFTDYEINNVKLEGTYTVTNTSDSQESNPKFTLALVSGKLTWQDGTSATRETTYTREWVRTNGGTQDHWLVTGSATGQNRQAEAYSLTITQQLVFQKSCLLDHPKLIAVQGKEELIVNPRRIDIDFGNGTCDEIVMVSINGKSKEVDVSGNN